MSKLCNIDKMYGQDFGVTVTNAPVSIIKKNGKQFIKNSLLISSPNMEENGFNDDGYPALFATDYEGNTTQLAYAIEQGNGLYINDNDRLNFSIDNDTIKEDNNQLCVNTTSLAKCNFDQLGVVQITDKVSERENSIYPMDSYIAVNNSGALFLSDSFYNYIWNYVKNEIKNAIQPLMLHSYYGYLIRKIGNNEEHIYESNTFNVISSGEELNFGFLYTSGSNKNSSITITNPENEIFTNNNSNISTITSDNLYGIITYKHKFDNNSIILTFPPNFYRSSDNLTFIPKLYNVYISINEHNTEDNYWENRQLKYVFLQNPGNYNIDLLTSSIDVVDILNNGNIIFEFMFKNFPKNDLLTHQLSLIWDKNGTNITLYSSESYISIGDKDATELIIPIKWKIDENSQALKNELNINISAFDNTKYQIDNFAKNKKYTLRLTTKNDKGIEISTWDNDFTVNYNVDNTITSLNSVITKLYIDYVCIAPETTETYITNNNKGFYNKENTIEWQFGEGEDRWARVKQFLSKELSNNTNVVNFKFNLEYNEDIISNIDDNSNIFSEDNFAGELILYKQNNQLSIKSNDNENFIIEIDEITNDIIISVKVDFEDFISSIISIQKTEIQQGSSYKRHDNKIKFDLIINHTSLSTQKFTFNIDVDSLMKNSIPYTFIDDNNEDIYQQEYISIDSVMCRLTNTVQIGNDDMQTNWPYKLHFDDATKNETNETTDDSSSTTTTTDSTGTTTETNNIITYDNSNAKIILTGSNTEEIYLEIMDKDNNIYYQQLIIYNYNKVDCTLVGFTNNNHPVWLYDQGGGGGSAYNIAALRYIYLTTNNDEKNEWSQDFNFTDIKYWATLKHVSMGRHDYENEYLKVDSTNHEEDFSNFINDNLGNYNYIKIDQNYNFVLKDNNDTVWFSNVKNKYIYNAVDGKLLEIHIKAYPDAAEINISHYPIFKSLNTLNRYPICVTSNNNFSDYIPYPKQNSEYNNANTINIWGTNGQSYEHDEEDVYIESGAAQEYNSNDYSIIGGSLDYAIPIEISITPTDKLKTLLYNNIIKINVDTTITNETDFVNSNKQSLLTDAKNTIYDIIKDLVATPYTTHLNTLFDSITTITTISPSEYSISNDLSDYNSSITIDISSQKIDFNIHVISNFKSYMKKYGDDVTKYVDYNDLKYSYCWTMPIGNYENFDDHNELYDPSNNIILLSADLNSPIDDEFEMGPENSKHDVTVYPCKFYDIKPTYFTFGNDDFYANNLVSTYYSYFSDSLEHQLQNNNLPINYKDDLLAYIYYYDYSLSDN